MVNTKSISLVIPFLAALQGVQSNPIAEAVSSSNLVKRIAQDSPSPAQCSLESTADASRDGFQLCYDFLYNQNEDICGVLGSSTASKPWGDFCLSGDGAAVMAYSTSGNTASWVSAPCRDVAMAMQQWFSSCNATQLSGLLTIPSNPNLHVVVAKHGWSWNQ